MTINSTKAATIIQALKSAGFSASVIPLIVAQVAHETGNFKSRVALQNNNYSGISFLNNPALQKNARRGLAFPKSEGKYYYAHFNTVQDWANDLKRILSRGAKPIDATTVDDFVNRLKRNKYFTAPVEVYKKNVAAWLQQISKIKPSTGGLLPLLLLATVVYLVAR